MPPAMRSLAPGLATPPSHRNSQTGYCGPGSGLRSPTVSGSVGAAAARLPAAVKWVMLLSLIAGMAMVLSWTQPAGDASSKVMRLRASWSAGAEGGLWRAGLCLPQTIQAPVFNVHDRRAAIRRPALTPAPMRSRMSCRQQER